VLPPSGLRPSHSPSPFCMFHKDTSKRFVVILRTNKLRSYNVKETRRSAIAEKMRGSTNAHKTHALHVYYVTINNVLRPTRLDYCNAVFAGLPKDTIAPLQRVQNAAARLILGLAPHDHVTAALRHLQTLSTYAPHSYPQGTILSQRYCHPDSISQFSWTASVRQQFPL